MMMDRHSLEETQPRAYDVQAAAELGLSDGETFNRTFFEAQEYYAELLIDYLDSKAGLRQLDAELSKHEMRFIPRQEPVNVYQACFRGDMRFLFLRSNVCVERLGKDELDTLLQLMDRGADIRDGEAEALIRDTFPAVTMGDRNRPADVVLIYERDGKRALNAGLVLGIATDAEFDENDMFVDAEHEVEKDEYLKMIVPQLEEQMSAALGYPVTIFLYM